ncbi:DUF488 domain-containing protein [bacterium]|nr:DUF488 domain-containing protein [bacterium]
MAKLFTIGHSNLAFDVFLENLRQAGIQILADVRTLPRSKHVPHFNRKELIEALPVLGITYHHIKELGGYGRESLLRSPNTGLPPAWQAYADYMLSDDFERGIRQIQALASIGLVALFCAEADWGKCHRRFIADALKVRGFQVFHLDSEGKSLEHELPPHVEIRKKRIIYPALGEQLSFF